MDKIAEINALKLLLAQTDYIALKVAEAEMYSEDMSEFAAVIEQRREWRRKINELESEVSEDAETDEE